MSSTNTPPAIPAEDAAAAAEEEAIISPPHSPHSPHSSLPPLPPLPPLLLPPPPAAAAVAAAAAAGQDEEPPPAKARRGKKGKRTADATTTTTLAAATTAATTTTATSLPKRVNKTSLLLKSDEPAGSPPPASGADPGMIHAARTSGGGERHAFAWLHDAGDESSTRALVDHLRGRGYRPGSMRFVPYAGGLGGWTARYPHAAPTVACGPDGRVRAVAPAADGRRRGGGGGGGEDSADDDGDGDDGGGGGGSRKRRKKDAGDGGNNGRKGGARPSPKLVAAGRLPNAERDELHRSMHSYLTWLHSELSEMETHQAGRRQVSAAGVSVPGLRSLIAKMEGTFKSIVATSSRSSSSSSDGVVGGVASGAGVVGVGVGGADGGVPGLPPLVQPGDGDDPNATTATPVPDGGDGGGHTPSPPRELPFLERALGAELRRRVSESLEPFPLAAAAAAGVGEGGEPSSTKRWSPSSSSSSTSARPTTVGVRPGRRRIDFDVLYRKLVEFKDENGHACPTLKHPELGWWVSELRARRKALREMGLEWEPPLKKAEGGGIEESNGDDEDDDREASTSAEADAEGAEGGYAAEEATTTNAPSTERGGDDANKSKPTTAMGNAHLSEVRVRLLDDISFVWWALPERVTWEQRLEELRAFREARGRFPTNKEGALGNWLKGQRKLYTKRDADFMAKKCAKVSGRVDIEEVCVSCVSPDPLYT
jgi:hypothetical protein